MLLTSFPSVGRVYLTPWSVTVFIPCLQLELVEPVVRVQPVERQYHVVCISGYVFFDHPVRSSDGFVEDNVRDAGSVFVDPFQPL